MTVNIAKRNYTNIKGVILDIYVSHNPGSLMGYGNTRVAFRPYGSSLGVADCFSPYASVQLSQTIVDYLRFSSQLVIPVGVNGGNLSFQIYGLDNEPLQLVFIGQRGICV